MKIVQPIGTIAGTAISRISLSLAEEFVRQGHECTLVVWNRDKISVPIDPRIQIFRINLPGLSRRNIVTKLFRLFIKTIIGNQLYLVFLAPFLSRQLQSRALDHLDHDVVILHAHSVFGFRFIKSAYLVVVHNIKSGQLLAGKAGWKQACLKRIYGSIYSGKHLAAVSQGIADDLSEVFKVRPASLGVIYNPLDIESVRANGANPYDPDYEYVIALGRNVPQKRFDRLIRVYAESGVSEHLLILGRADEDSSLHKLVKELGVEKQVHFLGFRDNPYAYISGSRCLLVTSDFEGFGMVIVEALSLGVPVISTDCPSGPREILGQDLEDCLIPVQDEDLFAQRLSAMMEKPVKFDPGVVDRFERSYVVDQYLLKLESIIR